VLYDLVDCAILVYVAPSSAPSCTCDATWPPIHVATARARGRSAARACLGADFDVTLACVQTRAGVLRWATSNADASDEILARLDTPDRTLRFGKALGGLSPPLVPPCLAEYPPPPPTRPHALPPGSLSSAHAQKTFARKKVDNTCPSVLPTRHRHASVHDVARELADRPHRAICTRR
jgi:hypothetical protein